MSWFPFMGWAPNVLSPFILLGILCAEPNKKGRPLGKKDSYKRKRRRKYEF